MSRDVHAFEREWHLGAGVGAVSGSGYELAPAFAVHGAYGISDVFDVRFTLSSASLHDDGDSEQHARLSRVNLGFAYKLDVIEWVPYFGVRTGAYYFGSEPHSPYARRGGSLGVMAGVDYSFSRSFALGAEIGEDLLLPEGRLFDALLHAEYRWGF